jgi:hypothetical protein
MAHKKNSDTSIWEIAKGLVKILIAGSVVLGIVVAFSSWYKSLDGDIKDYWIGSLTLIVGGICFFLAVKHNPRILEWINKHM